MKIIETFPFQGTKRKVLPQIIELFPKEEKFDVLYDVFTGSGVVGLNLAKYADKTICSDICESLIRLHDSIRNNNSFENRVWNCVHKYSPTKDGYLLLREEYNKNRRDAYLYRLIMQSFSNYMRFNKCGEFNLPYGERDSFNEDRLLNHMRALLEHKIVFKTQDCWKTFSDALVSVQDGKNTFLFCDSPYLGTTATYNEKNGWIENDEVNYYSWLDDLSQSGAKWMVTNTVHNRGFHNKHFEEFASRYNAVQTVSCFKNSSHQRTDKETVELIVRNW